MTIWLWGIQSGHNSTKIKQPCPQVFSVHGSAISEISAISAISEMPTSRDLKSGDSLFFTSALPRKFRTLYQVLHEVDTIQIRDHRFDARNNLCQ